MYRKLTLISDFPDFEKQEIKLTLFICMYRRFSCGDGTEKV